MLSHWISSLSSPGGLVRPSNVCATLVRGECFAVLPGQFPDRNLLQESWPKVDESCLCKFKRPAYRCMARFLNAVDADDEEACVTRFAGERSESRD